MSRQGLTIEMKRRAANRKELGNQRVVMANEEVLLSQEVLQTPLILRVSRTQCRLRNRVMIRAVPRLLTGGDHPQEETVMPEQTSTLIKEEMIPGEKILKTSRMEPEEQKTVEKDSRIIKGMETAKVVVTDLVLTLFNNFLNWALPIRNE